MEEQAQLSSTAQSSHYSGSVRELYFSLYKSDDRASAAVGRSFLNEQLHAAAALPADLPADPRELPQWVETNSIQTARQYQSYLRMRKEGAERHLFKTRSQALYSLQGVAPTKLVDGAWLYGLVDRWHDPRFLELLRIYLDELGEGRAEHNHVLLYDKLLATHACTGWKALNDRYFLQGAIQLAFARNAGYFLPELIGYNLGYEQLALHILITAHELKELGIDPHYFRLHVTIDNAGTGHAKQGLDAFFKARPVVGNRWRYYRRVLAGFRLNQLGCGMEAVAKGFNLKRELVSMLGAKSAIGRNMHPPGLRLNGRSINSWLSDPGKMTEFLDNLERRGWIERHKPPEESRFWKLIRGENARMYGVFNEYERQLLYDWIAGDAIMDNGVVPTGKQTVPYAGSAKTEKDANTEHLHDMDSECRALRNELADLSGRRAKMDQLVPLLGPSRHWTMAGLCATRIYIRLLKETPA